MKNVFIHPYKTGSESAKALANSMGVKRIALEGSKFKGSEDKIVINWGASSVSEEVAKCRVINKPEAVAVASDKLKFFNALLAYNKTCKLKHQIVKFPTFTTDRQDASYWVEDGIIVIARTVLNGHSGRGIVVIEDTSQMVDAPLYTRYIPKKQEYRVHVAGGQAVDVQRKARREGVPDDQINWRIRNHDNGFIFARNESLGEVPDHVLMNSVNAVKAIGLDFGAVDVVFNEKSATSYVLEVNTAPGLSGETLENYTRRMTELVTTNEASAKKSKKVSFNVDWANADPFADAPVAAPAARLEYLTTDFPFRLSQRPEHQFREMYRPYAKVDAVDGRFHFWHVPTGQWIRVHSSLTTAFVNWITWCDVDGFDVVLNCSQAHLDRYLNGDR